MTQETFYKICIGIVITLVISLLLAAFFTIKGHIKALKTQKEGEELFNKLTVELETIKTFNQLKDFLVKVDEFKQIKDPTSTVGFSIYKAKLAFLINDKLKTL